MTAVAKGLVSGNLTVHHREGVVQCVSGDEDAILIPNVRQINSVDVSRARWVLVVEKEASFRSCFGILSSQQSNAGGILITAKGYPDHLTKEFVHMLGMPSSKNRYHALPIYVLVDYDPDGYGIYNCYLPEPEDTSDQSHIRIVLLGLTFDQLHLGTVSASQASMFLTPRDRTRARNMLKTVQHDVRVELQRMLCLNTKLELQHLDDFSGGLQEVLTSGITEWQQE